MTEIVEASYFPQVDEIITLPIFRDCRVLGGAKGLNRLVEGINLSDTPDYYKWISKGEIMVTTCYAIYNDEQAVQSFIEKLGERGMAAVCIKPDQYLGKIPQVMIDQANAYQLPLIQLPPEVQFSDIIKGVSDELLNRQTALLQSTIRVNTMLTQTIVEGATLQDIARMISELSGTSALLLDTINNRKALHIAKKDSAELEGLNQEKAINTVITNSRVHELAAGEYAFGFLYLYGFEPATYLQSDILLQILQTVPLEISRERSIQERGDHGFAAYMRHLLSDPIANEEAERIRAAEYGVDLSHNHMILQIQMEEQAVSGGHYAVEFQRTLFISNLISLLSNLALSPKTIPSASGFQVLISTQANSNDMARLSARFPEHLRSLAREYPVLKLTGGCGRAHAGLHGLQLSQREAGIALKAASSRDGVLLRFEDLGILRLIFANDPEAEIEQYIHEKLGKLLDGSQPRKAELLQTLSAYFDTQGNVKRMSEELFTHYNTVVYRLKNIQDITGTDLRRESDRFELEMALYLYGFQQRGKEASGFIPNT